jgi:hypothetical protein
MHVNDYLRTRFAMKPGGGNREKTGRQRTPRQLLPGQQSSGDKKTGSERGSLPDAIWLDRDYRS